MPLNVIKVENLSKRFIISHEEKQRYTSLRDEISNRVKGLTKKKVKQGSSTKEEFFALRDIDFEINAGDRVGIVGRNGAGKSTLLKILGRITEPTTGRIVIRGRVASLLEVGTGFHPELTGRENIFLNGAILGMTRLEIKKKFDEIVSFAEIEKFLDTPVKRYSSGMYVRLAFAVAAHLEPEILIVDEVLAVGDAQFQKKCLGKMEDVSKNEGRTVLFVSHNVDAILNLCEKGILLSNGNLLYQGAIKKTISEYQNLFSSDLLKNIIWNKTQGDVNIPHILSASIELQGIQPSMELKVRFVVSSKSAFRPAFVAFDIQNSLGVVVMQALPTLETFIKFDGFLNEYESLIELKGIIPDSYYISIWIGPHNTETYDWIQNVLSFDILESPTKGRSFPHTHGHGFMVPDSTITIL
jgi:lipopolysaccharide transport system ATP-binding protein